jgi:hypothetical protein
LDFVIFITNFRTDSVNQIYSCISSCHSDYERNPCLSVRNPCLSLWCYHVLISYGFRGSNMSVFSVQVWTKSPRIQCTHIKFCNMKKGIRGPGIEPLSAQSMPPLSSWATWVHETVVMFSYK